ncbi:MAG TPA: molecular chaperone DnaK, partial [Candidatus Competibacteraceae bacterium]|nr:molecular chaperone DnaK [Candidatus Competibacteraceae bacterium]
LHVSAKDKATGKENRIVIKASSGLSEAEIKRMVGDAEAHAEEDKKFHELVNARNQAENLIHSAEKTLRDLGDKVEGSERSAIEAAISDLRTTAKTDNKSAIEAKTRTLGELSGKMAERLYAQSGGPEGGPGGPQGPSGGHKPADDGVVDAEFEEVKK